LVCGYHLPGNIDLPFFIKATNSQQLTTKCFYVILCVKIRELNQFWLNLPLKSRRLAHLVTTGFNPLTKTKADRNAIGTSYVNRTIWAEPTVLIVPGRRSTD